MKNRIRRFTIVTMFSLGLLSPETARAQIAITEFMAVADESYRDSDGAPSDWIELTNLGQETASLEGLHLTNHLADPTRWTLPAMNLTAGESIVIFASGKDRIEGSELHANFRLNRDGGDLALVAQDGLTIVNRIGLGTGYPEQFEGISYGLGIAGTEERITPVPFGASLKYHVPTNGNLGNDWTQTNFDDATWTNASAGIGFESSGGPLTPLVTTNIRPEMFGINASVYLRFPFELALESRQVLSLELNTYIDDGGSDY